MKSGNLNFLEPSAPLQTFTFTFTCRISGRTSRRRIPLRWWIQQLRHRCENLTSYNTFSQVGKVRMKLYTCNQWRPVGGVDFQLHSFVVSALKSAGIHSIGATEPAWTVHRTAKCFSLVCNRTTIPRTSSPQPGHHNSYTINFPQQTILNLGTKPQRRRYYSRCRGIILKWILHSWRIKDKLDVTCYFISLLMCSTCFGH